MTFSITARCARTGMFGVAVSSSSPCVAARCAHVRPGVGAVATQNITDPTIGPRALDMLAGGMSAPEAMAKIKAQGPYIEYRQVAIVDRQGRTAAYSGPQTLGTHRTVEEPNVIAAGNLLANSDVPRAMVDKFLALEGKALPVQLIAAMQAALDAGGEEGPVHSVGMLIVRDVAWPIADLRIDWHDNDPIGELAKLWELWEPQMESYVTRAINPTSAPSFGVPGDP
jgi:uncharacterized Ntn-hydrolase superfamily protein